MMNEYAKLNKIPGNLMKGKMLIDVEKVAEGASNAGSLALAAGKVAAKNFKQQ